MAEKPKSAAKAAPAKAIPPKPTAPVAKTVASAPAPAPAKKVIGGAKVKVTPEERYRLICEAAYYRAEKRNFTSGSDFQDWIDAEKEVDAKFCC